jgi:hypothetical protein
MRRLCVVACVVGIGVAAQALLFSGTATAASFTVEQPTTPPQPDIDMGRTGWFGWLVEHGSWVIAALAVVFAFARDMIKDWLRSAGNAIGDAAFNRLAGSRLLRRTAVHRYRRAVAEKYGSLRVLFRPGMPLDMGSIYVPLKLSANFDRAGADDVNIYELIRTKAKIVVTGPPGAGKSMLLRHLALEYATPRATTSSGAVLPVLLDLHRMSGLSLDAGLVEEQIIRQFGRDGFPGSDRFVRRCLAEGFLVVLLDGLDEVNSETRPRLASLLDEFVDTYEACSIIVTCRSAVYRSSYLPHASHLLRVAEFNDHLIQRFLYRWPGVQDRNSVNELLQMLHETPRVLELIRRPLLLTMLAYLYTDVYGGSSRLLPRSRVEFYRDATDVLLRRWHEETNNYSAPVKRDILKNLALLAQRQAPGVEDRISLDYRLVRSESARLLPDLGQHPDDLEPLLREIVERSGLLLEVDGGERYQFAHLTLQEYLAAAELAAQPDELLKYFLADPDVWRETVRLWCGAAGDSTQMIRQVRQVDPVLALECVADAQRVDQAVADEIIEYIKDKLESADDRVVRAVASVAIDPQPRGRDVYDFIRSALTGSHQRRRIAVRVLAATSLTESATILTDRLNMPDVPRLVIAMGDVAVPPLAELAREGSVSAMDALLDIATPLAAEALTELLWQDTNYAAPAAWRLAQLLNQQLIQEGLGEAAVPTHGRNLPRLDWVWMPFRQSASSSLNVIAGRIAYLLMDSGTRPLIPPPVDPRLVVPLVLVHPEGLRLEGTYQKGEKLERLLEKIKEFLEGPGGETISAGDRGQLRASLDWLRLAEYMRTPALESVFRILAKNSRLSEERHRAVEIILDFAEVPQSVRYLLECIPPRLRADLIWRACNEQRATTQNWAALSRLDDFNLDRSTHFQSAKLIYGLLLIVGGVSAVFLTLHASTGWGQLWIAVLSVFVVCGLFPLLLLRNDARSFFFAAFMGPVAGALSFIELLNDREPARLPFVANTFALPSTLWLTHKMAEYAGQGTLMTTLAVVLAGVLVVIWIDAGRRDVRVSDPLRGILRELL